MLLFDMDIDVTEYNPLSQCAGILHHGAPSFEKGWLDDSHRSPNELQLVLAGDETKEGGDTPEIQAAQLRKKSVQMCQVARIVRMACEDHEKRSFLLTGDGQRIQQ